MVLSSKQLLIKCANRFKTLSELSAQVPNRHGVLMVLSSPSGAGKTTIARRLLEVEPTISLSISVTTRPIRKGEKNGVDYHFIDRHTYEKYKHAGALMEYAEVFGNGYGTPSKPVERAIAEGRDTLFDIDWQGARQLRDKRPEDVVSVFILPPSAVTLEERLVRRAQDSKQVMTDRMARAAEEIKHWEEYDYVVINDRFEETVRIVHAILSAERVRRTRRIGLQAFITRMCEEL